MAVGLGVLTGVALIGATLVLLAPPSAHGAAAVALDLVRWLAAVVLSALLVLTSYLFASAIVLLAGVQLDELLRKTTGGRAHSVLDVARARRCSGRKA